MDQVVYLKADLSLLLEAKVASMPDPMEPLSTCFGCYLQELQSALPQPSKLL